MSNVQQIIKRNAYAFAAGLFTLAATVPSIVLTQSASALQITERSIAMSTSTVSASGASYQIKFDTATTSAVEGVVVDFCSESPILTYACTTPAGMTVGSTLGDIDGLDEVNGTWSASLINSNKSVLIENTGASAPISSGTPITIDVSGFTNPSAPAGTFYARVLTFVDADVADDYTSTVVPTHIDDGGVALSTTTAIGVTATVQESLVFCVAGAAIDDDCDNIGSIAGPSIVLGSGTPPVLNTSTADTNNVYYQVSTNAAQGVLVRMKGTTAGLMSGTNEIPALGDTAAAFTTDAGFGMRTASITGGTGTFAAEAPYNGGAGLYGMNDNGTNGVNSTYGDIIAQSAEPLLNKNATLEFAAKASGTTPAGVYTASFSLIASGSY